MGPTRWIALGISAAALAAAGCGSGKQSVSAAELSQKGDSICGQEQTRFNQIQAQPPANAAIAADQTRELIGAAESASGDLGGLEPPEALRNGLDSYLEARDRAVDQMRRGQQAAEDQDSAAYASAQTAVAKSAAERRKLAASLGLRKCSANPRGV